MTAIRNIFALFAVFSFCLCAPVAEIYADTHTAKSCSFADVSTAITAASRGDAVLVPAGSCTWSSRLIIRKGLILQGEGIGSTIINSAQSSIIVYGPDATALSNNERFELSGFELRGNGVGGSSGLFSVDTRPSSTAISNIVIHDNKFFRSASKLFDVKGNVYGVAYNNEFDGWYAINCLGNFRDSWDNYEFDYGTANNFYFEDNLFKTTQNDANGVLWVEAGQGGRYALRYNTWDLDAQTSGIDLWDMHGNQGNYGTMGAEIYGNSIINGEGNGGYRWIDQRGGELLMFINHWSSSSGGFAIDLDEEYDDSSDPCNSCTQHINNSYFWSNYHNTTLKSAVEGTDCCDAIAENSEFWNHNTSYNGTTEIGVYCGNSLPANCTTGDGAWITNQSCSTLTGMIGQDPSTPILGTFYKCTATNTWTSYYTPYTYPHPLRNPKAPANLRIVPP